MARREIEGEEAFMTHETEMRMIAFVRSIARECSICLRKADGRCDSCPSQWARRLLGEITDAERPAPEPDYSFYTRTKRILAALHKANRPLCASEIDLRGLCSPQLKAWTLNQMCANGVLGKRFAYSAKSGGRRKRFFCYFINKEKQK